MKGMVVEDGRTTRMMLALAQRERMPLSLVVIDIDTSNRSTIALDTPLATKSLSA